MLCPSSSPGDPEAHQAEDHQPEWILKPNPAREPICLATLHTEVAKQTKQLIQVYCT